MCRAAAAIATLVVALTLLSCGGGESEEDRVTAAIESMQDDMAAGRIAAVCAAMTTRPQRQIGSIGHARTPTTCERDVRELVLSTENAALSDDEDGLRSTAKPRVLSVDLDEREDAGVATMTLGADPFRIELVKEGDRWKLDDFLGALAPPPGALR